MKKACNVIPVLLGWALVGVGSFAAWRNGSTGIIGRSYQDGVNHALEAAALLSLEQQIQGTNRTWATMAEIVCQRLGVENTVGKERR